MPKRSAALILAIMLIVSITGCVGDAPQPVPPYDTVISDTAVSHVVSTPVITPSHTPYDPAYEMLLSMSPEEKIAQLFIVRPESISDTGAYELTPGMREALCEVEPCGFVFFSGNIKSPSQLRGYTEGLKDLCRFMPFICVDEEGGTVARLANTSSLHLPKTGNMRSIGNTGDTDKAYEAGLTVGGYLSEYGFDVDFAPVADVVTVKGSVVDKRSFGTDPYLVCGMSGEFSRGLHERGVLSVFKHFPGHGGTTGDTHTDYAEIRKTWDELLSCELIPFMQNMGNADMIMVSHITLPRVTGDDMPSSLSHTVITERLRGEMGYSGVVITDGMEMDAIAKYYTPGEAAYLAFCAGCDIILLPDNYGEAYSYMLDAFYDGKITPERLDESVLRILNLKFSARK